MTYKRFNYDYMLGFIQFAVLSTSIIALEIAIIGALFLFIWN
jgi:hypothetical protein